MNAPLFSPTKKNERGEQLRKDKESFGSLQSATEERLRETRAGNLRVKQTEKVQTTSLDLDTAQRVMRANKKLSLFLYHLANEPSVGLFHTATHVHKSVPHLVQLKKAMASRTQALEQSSYTLEETMSTVRSINSVDSFGSVAEMLGASIQNISDILKIPAPAIPTVKGPSRPVTPSPALAQPTTPPRPTNEAAGPTIVAPRPIVAAPVPTVAAEPSVSTPTAGGEDPTLAESPSTPDEPSEVITVSDTFNPIDTSDSGPNSSASLDGGEGQSQLSSSPSASLLIDEVERAKSKKKKKPTREFRPKNF